MKFDKRRKYYLILDCETATLPFVSEYSPRNKKKIAIAKPLIYDIGWQIIDNKGRLYKKESFLITEIFSCPAVFNTAYYKEKRPIYLEKLKNNEIILNSWENVKQILIEDLQHVEAIGAYNSMFDYKKAIPFTDLYIEKLYSPDYYKWEYMQKLNCDAIINDLEYEKTKEFDAFNFTLDDVTYPLFDLWGLSVKYLLNNEKFKKFAYENKLYTNSEKYFSTTAETTYRFLMNDIDFIESHTAIDDVIIESNIFAEVHKKSKGKWERGIIYFPFRILGTIEEFILKEELL